ncbi:MAG TPA: hypothetical protein GX517_02265 [Alicyclobacillus sp.]|nr:hypothetical protein [Alicyclobacillus sp.]
MSKPFGEIRDEQAEAFLKALQNGHDGQGLTVIAASYPSMRHFLASGDNGRGARPKIEPEMLRMAEHVKPES